MQCEPPVSVYTPSPSGKSSKRRSRRTELLFTTYRTSLFFRLVDRFSILHCKRDLLRFILRMNSQSSKSDKSSYQSMYVCGSGVWYCDCIGNKIMTNTCRYMSRTNGCTQRVLLVKYLILIINKNFLEEISSFLKTVRHGRDAISPFHVDDTDRIQSSTGLQGYFNFLFEENLLRADDCS